MVKPIVIEKSKVEKEPYLIWNTFNSMMAENEFKDLSEVQSLTKRAWRYDSEVQNGGHLQLFENLFMEYEKELNSYIKLTIDAVNLIGANKQAKILEDAADKYFKERRKHPTTVEEFEEREKEEEFEKYDNKYYKCSPEIMDYLEKFLQSHQGEFIELVF